MWRRLSLGSLLIWIGILMLAFTFTPVLLQEVKYDFTPKNKEYQIVSSPSEVGKLPEPTLEKTVIVPKSFEFSLVVPEIGVNSLVFPNVDSSDPKIYLPILKKGVAHALNSSLPNQAGPVFIFAHSTDSFYNIAQYNAVFFLLNKLRVNDDIYIFYKNKKYHYQVTDKQIVMPELIPGIVSGAHGNLLILQTCYPPGTVLKRLLVFAKLT